MFNDDETRQLQALFKKSTHTVELTFHPALGNDFSRKLEFLGSEVCRLSEGKCIPIPADPGAATVAAPCIKIGSGGHANIAYAALPKGHQFAPFLKILERIGAGDYRIPGDGASSDLPPAQLLVLISDSCPRCPLVVEAAGSTACGEPSIDACFIDVMQFQDFVIKYRIKSVPATIVDGRIVLIGALSADRILALVRSRGTPEFEMEEVRSLIETQNIDMAAQRLAGKAGRAVVLDLIQDAEFSKRLSALVVMQQALEENPDAVRLMVPSLLPLLSHSDSRIRGDVADLLGKIGDPQAVPFLESLAADPDPDVAEAATDALEELKQNGT